MEDILRMHVITDFDHLFPHSSAVNISTSYACSKFCRVLSLGLTYFCALILFNYTSEIHMYPSPLSLIYPTHVIPGLIILWNKIFLFFF